MPQRPRPTHTRAHDCLVPRGPHPAPSRGDRSLSPKPGGGEYRVGWEPSFDFLPADLLRTNRHLLDCTGSDNQQWPPEAGWGDLRGGAVWTSFHRLSISEVYYPCDPPWRPLSATVLTSAGWEAGKNTETQTEHSLSLLPLALSRIKRSAPERRALFSIFQINWPGRVTLHT